LITVPSPLLISTVRPAARTRKVPTRTAALVRPTERRSTSRPPPRTSPSPTVIFTMSRPSPENSARPCSSTVDSTVLAGIVSSEEPPSVTAIQGNSSRAVASDPVLKLSPVRILSPSRRCCHEDLAGSSARSSSRSSQASVPMPMPAPRGRGVAAGVGVGAAGLRAG
jgi:hypothetical protein